MPLQEPSPDEQPGDIKGLPSYPPQHDLLADPLQVDIGVSHYHLKDIFNDFEKQWDRPTFEDSFPYIGLLLAFLLPLIPADYESFLGFSGDVWTAVSLFAAIAAGVKVLSIWWAIFRRWNEPYSTPEEVVRKLEDQLKSRRDEQRQTVANIGDQSNEQANGSG